MHRIFGCLVLSALVALAGCKEDKPAECGNGSQEKEEVCDGADVQGQNCQDHGFLGGTLRCNSTCSAFVYTACTGGCGNDLAEDTDDGLAAREECDGSDVRGQNCNVVGFELGTVTCSGDCVSFVTTDCYDPTCGDGTIEGSEDCEPDVPLTLSCISLEYNEGTLGCQATTGTEPCQFDESGCVTWVCGNGIVEGLEQCDGTELDGETCDTVGFDAGDLACLPDTDVDPCHFDTSACYDYECGNDIVEGDEDCEPGVAITATCVEQGFESGTLGCLAAGGVGECAFDLGACVNGCGNNLIELAEVCDGTNVGTATCITQGFTAGDLLCNGDCSGYDTTGCIS